MGSAKFLHINLILRSSDPATKQNDEVKKEQKEDGVTVKQENILSAPLYEVTNVNSPESSSDIEL